MCSHSLITEEDKYVPIPLVKSAPSKLLSVNFSKTRDVEEDTTLYAHDFALGENDRLRINNEPYRGDVGPNGVIAREGTQVRFIVEEKQGTPAGEEFDNGFKICTYPDTS